MSRLRQYPKWKACVILISLGIFILSFGIKNLARDYRSFHWPSTSGTIRSATMTRSISWRRGSQYLYEIDILYDYQVAGISYSSTRVSLGGLNGLDSHDDLRPVRDRYPKGKHVAVSYDPSDPATAILEPKMTSRAWAKVAFGALFLLWGTLPLITFVSRASDGNSVCVCQKCGKQFHGMGCPHCDFPASQPDQGIRG